MSPLTTVYCSLHFKGLEMPLLPFFPPLSTDCISYCRWEHDFESVFVQKTQEMLRASFAV